ncbi:MAG TPA: ABC transporter ATP-binding protein [Isosphaeraceae bacterium]|nr:ABC transporter ATP-binding protein [Isosphaeraceae bacterium]
MRGRSLRPGVMTVLEARDVTKTYRDGGHVVHALRGVSLTVARGEVLAIEGPSGSGKTTLLCILGCLLTPTSGRIVIDGREVDAHRPRLLRDLRRRSIGFVFQQFNLFESLTAAENVQYGLNLKGWSGPRAVQEADRVLEAVGLEDRKDFLPRDLSGGQRQRVAVARALAGPARVLLADEPTGNLDSVSGDRVLGLFRDLARSEGRALVIVTHDPRVRTIADRVVTIRDGQLLHGES